MNVLPLPNSLSNLQKCYLPMKYFLEIGNYFNKYVLLEINSLRFVVQICFKTDLHELYCCLDETVCFRQNISLKSVVYKTCDISKITLLHGPVEAKRVYVSIAFESIDDLVKWKEKVNVGAMLLNILKLFGLYNGCNVDLNACNKFLNLGIDHIIIDNIVLKGKSKVTNLDQIVAKVVNSTDIIVEKESLLNEAQLQLMKEIGVLEKPYLFLREVINESDVLNGSSIPHSKNVLLIGPSGCGKKTLVRKVANDCGALLIELKGAEILSPKIGLGRPGEVEENIRRFFGSVRTICNLLISSEYTKKHMHSKENRKCRPQIKNEDAQRVSKTSVILLLTNLELMCPNRRRSIGRGIVGQIAQLVNSIDELRGIDNLLIFATTSKVDDLDPSVRRPGRLDREVFIGIPTEEERACILEKLVPVDAAGKNGDISVLAKSAASITPGRVAAELCLLCQQVNRIRIIRKLPSNQELQNVSKAWLEDFADCAAKLPVSTILHGAGTLLTYKDLNSSHDLRPSLSSIGGLASVKDRLRISIKEPLIHPEAFKLLGVRPPRGVLLYGPPGCAKTTLARALAMPDSSNSKNSTIEPSITFLSCSAAELYSPYVGESEKKVVELFQRARAGAPSILFIDELDAIFGSREGMQKGGVQERVLSALLTEMDGVGHRVVAPKANLHNIEGDLLLVDAKEKDQSVKESNERSCININSFSLVTVIAATNRPDLIDEAVLRPGRLDQLIFIPPPNTDGRLEILSHYTSKMPIQGNKELILKNLADKTYLYSGADLKNLCKEAALCALTEGGFNVQEVEEKHFMKALQSSRPSLNLKQILLHENFSTNKYGK